jgi:hypothetical protein
MVIFTLKKEKKRNCVYGSDQLRIGGFGLIRCWVLGSWKPNLLSLASSGRIRRRKRVGVVSKEWKLLRLKQLVWSLPPSLQANREWLGGGAHFWEYWHVKESRKKVISPSRFFQLRKRFIERSSYIEFPIEGNTWTSKWEVKCMYQNTVLCHLPISLYSRIPIYKTYIM